MTAQTRQWTDEQHKRLREDVASIAAAAPGRWSVAVHEAGSVIIEIDADVVQHPASTIKVPIMAVVGLDVAAGRRSLDDVVALPPTSDRAGGSGVLPVLPTVTALSLAEVVELMIIVSDNAATNAIIDVLGVDRLRDGFAELGLTGTRCERHLMDLDAAACGLTNETTARDQARLLDLIARGSGFPSDVNDWMLGVLERQQFGSRLPARVADDDVVVRHKTGTVDGVEHDVGILEFDGRRVSVAVLGRDLPEAGQTFIGVDVISRIASEVVDAARAVAR